MLSAQSSLDIVGSAASGEEALAIIKRNKPDLLLLDLRMPGMDGIGVLQALKKIEDRPRVIILTSFDKDEDIYRAIRAGAQGYLPSLTAVAQSPVEMAQRASALLFERIANNGKDGYTAAKMVLPVRLIIRNSCGCIS